MFLSRLNKQHSHCNLHVSIPKKNVPIHPRRQTNKHLLPPLTVITTPDPFSLSRSFQKRKFNSISSYCIFSLSSYYWCFFFLSYKCVFDLLSTGWRHRISVLNSCFGLFRILWFIRSGLLGTRFYIRVSCAACNVTGIKRSDQEMCSNCDRNVLCVDFLIVLGMMECLFFDSVLYQRFK